MTKNNALWENQVDRSDSTIAYLLDFYLSWFIFLLFASMMISSVVIMLVELDSNAFAMAVQNMVHASLMIW